MNDFKLNRRLQYKKNRKQFKMSVVNAAIAAGFPRSVIDKHRSKLPMLLTPTDRTDFFALFEQRQMSDVKKVEHAIAGMQAEKVIVDKDGVEHRTPDWNSRHKYFETVLKLCKQLDKEDARTNVLVLGKDFAEQLRLARERATEERKAALVKEDVDEGVIIENDKSVDLNSSTVHRSPEFVSNLDPSMMSGVV